MAFKSKKSKYDDISCMVNNFSRILESLGEYLINIGKVEKENPKFKKIMDNIKDDPYVLEKTIEQIPKELENELLNLFLQMVMIQNKARNVDSLSWDEKINIGEKLKDLSKKFKNVDKKIK